MPGGSAIQELCEYSNTLFSRRGSLLDFWQTTAELFYPERADFTTQRSIGNVESELMESSPPLFRRDFANFLGTILRPKGRKWWKFAPDNERLKSSTAAKRWLEAAEDQTWSLLRNRSSRFAQTMREADNDYVTFGNAVTSLRERNDRAGLLFQCWHLRDCAWAENADQDIDTMHRKYQNQARDLVRLEGQPGWDIHPQRLELVRVHKRPYEWCNLVQIDMPADEQSIIPRKKLKGMKWVCFVLDLDHQWLCYSKAIAEFPYMVSRWHTVSGSPYAYSPSVVVGRPDSCTMQDMTRVILEAGEKAVNPPLVATQNAIQGPVNIYAGGVTWTEKNYDERSGAALRPLDLGDQPQLGMLMRQDVRETLYAAFFLNKLFLPQQGNMTAEEIDKRTQEFLRSTQPIVEPAEPERNGLTLDLTMRMMLRLGAYGDVRDIPQELAGQEIGFEYDNPIADAKKALATSQFRQAVGLAVEGAQVDPSMGKMLNGRDAYRDAVEGTGAPADWLKSEDEMKEVDAQAQQDQAQQKMMDQANAAATVGVNAGNAIQALSGQKPGTVKPQAPQPGA